MPPPTSYNPVPHVYFLTWNNGEGGRGGGHIPLFASEDGKQPSNDILFSVWCFYLLMWLYVETRRQHRENDIIWGSLSLGSRGRRSDPLLSSPLLASEQGNDYPHTLALAYHDSFHREKVQLSIFTCAPRNSSSRSCILLSHQFAYPIHFTLKAPYCIYIMIIPDFFFLLWMFLCCTPSFLVVYWLLSCGMFVLSQSNVVFTLKPHFS